MSDPNETIRLDQLLLNAGLVASRSRAVASSDSHRSSTRSAEVTAATSAARCRSAVELQVASRTTDSPSPRRRLERASSSSYVAAL